MNPYINHLAGFGAGFIAFFPVESVGGGGSTKGFIFGSFGGNVINIQQVTRH